MTEPDSEVRPGLRLSFAGVYEALLEAFGPQHWWPADTPFEVAVGAVLTQNTAWTNVERAIANLKDADCLTPGALLEVPHERLAGLIRPAGYFNVKAGRLRALCEFLVRECPDGDIRHLAPRPTPAVRSDLLRVKGVGEETADSILLYALDHPVFVVDAYTVRIFERLGLLEPGLSYGDVQERFHAALPSERALFNEYHALVVALGKDYCKPRPRCGTCPLRGDCPASGTPD
ncbi:endonuclease [Thiohalorhabdus denitrificans]|uniref:DNA-3-methyladenine glycosylase III n=1 Tax=Thiohalorhabdus denitrificans TaxID=381306 RepID=A0A0P9CAM7_9GAMM|nr:endonuclease [Thiohalorhabdus denitrificans]KPV40046.1 endonuclease [Thiohalorhabdus denitrificans]SCY13552.1 DNA-3-methyladenine glycosylase III [Thiohalorhabdus denitrificans]